MLRPKSAAPANSGPPAPTNWADYLGKKISIRYQLAQPGQFSEAVGVVQAVRGGVTGPILEVLKRTGEVVAVEIADITHLKGL